MNDMLKVLKEVRAEAESSRLFHDQRVVVGSEVSIEWCDHYTKRLTALDRAIAIITEADALLPVLQQMAHSVALGDAGDGALKRLISLLSAEGAGGMQEFKLVPAGGEVAFDRVNAGVLFQFGETVCLMSEYDFGAIVVGSGEMFWGGTNASKVRSLLMVQPLQLVHVTKEDWP